jgi:membrane protein DedA with SNARE-associated domain
MGVPIPGETALVAAALYAGKTQALNIWVLILLASAGLGASSLCFDLWLLFWLVSTK